MNRQINHAKQFTGGISAGYPNVCFRNFDDFFNSWKKYLLTLTKAKVNLFLQREMYIGHCTQESVY